MEQNTEKDLFATIFPLVRKIESFFTHLARPSGVISGSQVRVLGYLIDHSSRQEIFQKDVEQMFQISPPSATSLLRSLESQGLITREKCDADARCKKIVLTPKSVPLQEQVLHLKEQCYDVLLQDIPQEKLDVFFEVCQLLAANSKKKHLKQ